VSDIDINKVREQWNTAMRPKVLPPPPIRITNGYTLWMERQEEKRKMPLLKRIIAEIKDWFEA